MEANKQQLTGMKKRQQIASANKKIFIWVIIASVAVSLCGVTIQFLFKQAAFNQKVISAKADTQSTLSNNITNASQLKTNVDALLADSNLAKVKANPSDTTLKVVLDALPTEDDKSALGASLQQVILPRSGVTASDITTISDGLVTLGDETTEANTESSSTPQPTSFNFTASGDYDRIKGMLTDLERTIRPMNIQTISFQSSDGNIRTVIAGNSYYQAERSVQLGKRTLKP